MLAAHADNDNNTLIPDNKRLNDGVVANVYTIQHQAGCTNDLRIDPRLPLAAQWHTNDVGQPRIERRQRIGRINTEGVHRC